MTSLLANFMKSGNLAADADDHVRDLKFFQDFSHQAASLVLGVYVLGSWQERACMEHVTVA